MAIIRYVNIDLPEASRLADLYGMAIDISAAIAACEAYLSADPLEYAECLSSCLFVKYGRCFKGGVRIRTSKELEESISPEDRELHQLIIDYRDKYVSHSVNDFERHRVRVWLNPEERGKKINSVNIESHYLLAPGDKFNAILSLCRKHLEWIENQKKIEEAKLKKIVESRHTLDAIYALNSESAPTIDYDKIAKTRKWQ